MSKTVKLFLLSKKVYRRKFILSLRLRSNEIDSPLDTNRTLDVLFKCGFEPNERLEALLEHFDGHEDLVAHTGFAPVQILTASALDAMHQKDNIGGAAYMTCIKAIAGVIDYLVRHGARISLDAPLASRSNDRRSSSMVDSSTGSQEDGDSVLTHDRSRLKLHNNKQLLDMLGAARLSSAEKAWNEQKAVRSSGTFIFHTDKLVIEDSMAPGGSDVKSCAICWKPFGAITNRKHRCRVARRHVCDECSSKRIVEGVEEHRVSDGQFLVACADQTASKSRDESGNNESGNNTPSLGSKQKNFSAASALSRLESEEATNRESLFGNVMENVARAVFGEEEQGTTKSHSDSIGGLSESLNQTKNQLLERGDKLNTLADKSDRLVNASKDFASMAKELNRKSQGGFFW